MVQAEADGRVYGPPMCDRVSGRSGNLIFPHTDAQGRCRIEGIPDVVSSSLYAYVARIGHLQYGYQALEDVDSLPREGTVARSTVHLEQRSSLSGQVVCADTGEPIENADVRVVMAATEQEWAAGVGYSIKATTGPDGRYEACGLLDRPHNVWVLHSGWSLVDDLSVDVPHSGECLIQMQRGRVIRGQVLDRSGEPAVGAEIRSGGPGARLHVKDATTDEAGRFEVGGLSSDGPVWLAAKHASPFEAYGLARVDPDDDSYVVFDGREMVELDGAILDDTGQPIQVRVSGTIWAYAGTDVMHFVASTPLEAPGRFRALLPPNGKVILTLDSEEDCFTSPFYNAERITMRNGQPDRPLTFAATPPSQLRLRFLDAQSGQPVPTVDVTLHPATDHWGLGWNARSDQDGVAVFEYLPSGDVEIRTIAYMYEPIEERRIELSTNGEVEIRLTPKG